MEANRDEPVVRTEVYFDSARRPTILGEAAYVLEILATEDGQELSRQERRV